MGKISGCRLDEESDAMSLAGKKLCGVMSLAGKKSDFFLELDDAVHEIPFFTGKASHPLIGESYVQMIIYKRNDKRDGRTSDILDSSVCFQLSPPRKKGVFGEFGDFSDRYEFIGTVRKEGGRIAMQGSGRQLNQGNGSDISWVLHE